MLSGLEKTAAELEMKNIPFVLLQGSPKETVVGFVKKYSVGELVCDFNPLRSTPAWRKTVAESIPVKMTEVDARNIIPCWKASDKQEYAAYTFRPKIHKQLKVFLTDFPALETQIQTGKIVASNIQWDVLLKNIQADRDVKPVGRITPGTQAAKIHAQAFISRQLDEYNEKRNDPNQQGTSHMSPYLHFGQISARWLAYQVNNATDTSRESRDVYLEELIVRRELTDIFCFYNADYDKVAGAHTWAQKTIAEHAEDQREYTYQRKQLEEAGTHDELCNAMQRQMVTTGKMHGWCRMYWAKKNLEWSDNTQMAIDRALYLNDKYELDGNDPNGVVGVMWSICGVHDRAWTERPIFGKIRYMNLNGAKRKFDGQAYIDTYSAGNTLFDE
jgi:deoxyribodipyrimidine photo-lyase